jgi:[protein-PII] uridylyltransferase
MLGMWRGDFDWAPADPGGLSPPSAEYLASFAASMPARYRVLFDQRAIVRHAAIALSRGTRPACAEVWRSLPDGSAAMCIVAEDRPGLLSAIAAALVLHKLDVLTALVFSRSLPGGESEAVDLVWVRRASQNDVDAIGGDETESIGEVLGAIVSGKVSTEQIASQATAPPRDADPSVVVHFDPVDEDTLAPLRVEAPDRPGMLLTITLALFQQGTQIVRSLVRTAGGRAFNRFELSEFSGAALSEERREQVRTAVHAALTLAAHDGGSTKA